MTGATAGTSPTSFSRKRKRNAFATDDAHFKTPDHFGGWVHVKADSLDPDALLFSLKQGHYYSSMGPQIHAIEMNGKEISIACSPVDTITVLCGTSRTAVRNGRAITDASFDLKKLETGWLLKKQSGWFRVVGRARWRERLEQSHLVGHAGLTPLPLWLIICGLGITQIIGWGTTYYALGALSQDIAASTGWSSTLIFGAFSAALLLSGIISPSMARLRELAGRYPGRIAAQAGPLAEARPWSEMERARRDGAPSRAAGPHRVRLHLERDRGAPRRRLRPVHDALRDRTGADRRGRPRRRLAATAPRCSGCGERHLIALARFEECRACDYRPYCTGNCPGLAFSLTGEVDRPSPDACLKRFLRGRTRSRETEHAAAADACDPASPLTQLYVYLTEGCNLACRHCWIAPTFDDDGTAAPIAAAWSSSSGSSPRPGRSA